MTTLNQLSEKTKEPINLLIAKAKKLGFSKNTDADIPEDILSALTGPKQIASNSTVSQVEVDYPEQQKESSQNKKTSNNEVEEIHQAFFEGNENLEQSNLEMELEAAKAMGRMEAHQIYLNYKGAKMSALRTLRQQDSYLAIDKINYSSEKYRAAIEYRKKEALQGWASSDKAGKSIQECLKEIKQLNASFE